MFTFKLRRDSSTMWAAKNPILPEGEPGYETDTGRFKVGTGNIVPLAPSSNAWVTLSGISFRVN